MTDMTPKEMGLRLRTMFIGRGNENFLQYQARIAQEACELANILDPTAPKFKEGDWVTADWDKGKIGRIISSAGRPYLSSNQLQWKIRFTCQEKDEFWPTDRLQPLGFDPLEYAKLIHEGKPLPGYISTKGLHELPKDREYAVVADGEYFLSSSHIARNKNDRECYIVSRRKAQQ